MATPFIKEVKHQTQLSTKWEESFYPVFKFTTQERVALAEEEAFNQWSGRT